MTYADVLFYYMEQEGITQAELARRIGTSRSTVNSLLNGKAKAPTLYMAKQIADALAVPLDEMARKAYGAVMSDYIVNPETGEVTRA